MTDSSSPDIEPVLQKADAACIPFYRQGTSEYQEHVQVKNARLHTAPQVIAPCKDADAFSFWLAALDGYEVPISIRSGGHHHEGMCSNDGGVVLLASSERDIEIDLDEGQVWLGTGQALKGVIEELGAKGRILPTGGCGTVNVGGLTHGGGWGMSYRTWGLTSDALLAVEMVLPNGDKVTIGRDGLLDGHTTLPVDPADLFWAIRGGGGGNFGVVTRFLFEIFEPETDHYTEFTLQWDGAARQNAAEAWADLCWQADQRLNTFARMTVMDDVTHKFWNPPFLVGGRFYGEEEDCREALADFLKRAPTDFQIYKTVKLDGSDAFLGALMLNPGMGPSLPDGTLIPPQGYALQVSAPKPDGPADTCVPCPEPHKVCSTMPGADHAAVMQAATEFVCASDDEMDVNFYLSLHGMGGAGAEKSAEDGAFPWRHKPYMLQIQAWWNPGAKTPEQEAKLIDWVARFRQALEPHCEGAFINFPDQDQPVPQYYGASWDRLCAVKAQVDPGNRLHFPMGVLPLFMKE